jgi:glucose-1-phosphate cytidylyltransferase
MKVVILCGGMGTRMKEETEFKPKPLVLIGKYPILWHIMKHYAHYGFNEFILCLGYKGEMIKDYFLNYDYMANDFTLGLDGQKALEFHRKDDIENWKITFVDTGLETNTGGRIKKIQKFIKDDNFFCTYGDGVSDVNILKLLEFHKKRGKIVTLTGLHPVSKYGIIKADNTSTVNYFVEKPIMKDLTSGGYFIFNRKIFDYLDENSVLEKEPFEILSKKKQISVFKHDGFWMCMDTYKEAQKLNDIWNSGKPPWRIWK